MVIKSPILSTNPKSPKPSHVQLLKAGCKTRTPRRRAAAVSGTFVTSWRERLAARARPSGCRTKLFPSTLYLYLYHKKRAVISWTSVYYRRQTLSRYKYISVKQVLGMLLARVERNVIIMLVCIKSKKHFLLRCDCRYWNRLILQFDLQVI